MKKSILLALISFNTFAQELPPSTLGRLQKLYPEQSKEYLKERYENAPTAFKKWRSFPPYYYEMINRSSYKKMLSGRKGICAGDPHLENFGFIAGSDEPVFTVNDMDDVTRCSLDADLMRLLIGHKLYNNDFSVEKFLIQYQNGLSGKSCPESDYIKKLAKGSRKKSKELSKKNKAMLDSKTCSGEYEELSSAEKNMLDDFIKAENGDQTCINSDVLSSELKELAKTITETNPKEIIHACSRTKDSGGSAGGKRYVVFRKSKAGVIDAFELKPLAKPAPDFNLTVSDELRAKKYEEGVKTMLGENYTKHYYPVVLNKVLYQRRPLWAGNEGVDSQDIEKLDPAQREGTMFFEACELGRLHSHSNKSPFVLKPQNWENAAASLEEQFRKEMGIPLSKKGKHK